MDQSRWLHRRIALTGGTSLIGSFLVEKLISLGATVRVASRDENRGFPDPPKDKIEWRVGDVADEQFCEKLLEDCDELIHAASFRKNVAYHSEHRDEVIQANEAMTSALIGVLKKKPLPVTFFSTAMVGMVEHPQQSEDGYIAGKAQCEQLWERASHDIGFPLLTVRPVNAYGPRDTFTADSNVIPALIARAMQAKDSLTVWGSGTQIRSFVYAPDVAEAVIRLLEDHATGIAYVSPPDRIDIRRLATLIRDLVHSDLTLTFDTSKPEGPSFVADLPLHHALTNFPWTGIEEGLKETVEWYRG